MLGSSLPRHINPACSDHSCPAKAGNLGSTEGQEQEGVPIGNSRWVWLFPCSWHFKRGCGAVSGLLQSSAQGGNVLFSVLEQGGEGMFRQLVLGVQQDF